MTDLEKIDKLQQENASLRRSLVDHPATQTLRFVAPFIRSAMNAGVWAGTPGADSVEHELNAALVGRPGEARLMNTPCEHYEPDSLPG